MKTDNVVEIIQKKIEFTATGNDKNIHVLH